MGTLDPQYIYDNTTGGFAHRCNSSLTGEESNIHLQPSYTSSDDSHYDVGQMYWLSTGVNYGVRFTSDGTLVD